MSEETVEILGQTLPLGEALDLIVRNIQDILNNTHCAIREIVFLPDTVESSFEKSHILSNNVQDMVGDLKLLLSELNKVVKKVPFKAESNEEKQFVKEYNEKRKNDRKTIDLNKFK